MGSPLPPDPYHALGVAKDASAAAIKTQYRKLVLKFHPDKVQGEHKQAASDRFHSIQTAYEIVGDEDRRNRYDAQCKLADLRKEMMERGGGSRGGVEVRTASYKMSSESARGGDFYTRGPERSSKVSPRYEERRPDFAHEGYFDMPPRATARKSDEPVRPRRSPREEREKPKSSSRNAKENERSSRKEKSRHAAQDMHRDRDRKFQSYVQVEEEPSSSSDSDQYERARRRMRQEDEEARAKMQYYEISREQKEKAESGYYGEDRARKTFLQHEDARDYITRSTRGPALVRPESERRPSPPTRAQTSKDGVEYIKRGDGRPAVMIRRGSGRPKTTGRDLSPQPRRASARERGSRPSMEIVDDPRDARKPPTLNKSTSSPPDVHAPYDKQRSKSLQENHVDEPPPPPFRRSETLPTSPTSAPTREPRRKENSKLRAELDTEYLNPEPEAHKYNYGQQYADDGEYATPDGYRTEVREPAPRQTRLTRSPSPMKERERQRSTSTKYASPQPPPMPRTTSTSYVYPQPAGGDSYSGRPAVSRENSGRPNLSRSNTERPTPSRGDSGHGNLFGEIPTTTSRSPRASYSKYATPPSPSGEHQYSREFKPEDVKFQTGYARRSSRMNERPSYGRTNSRQAVY